MDVPAAHLRDRLEKRNSNLNGGFRHSDGWREWPLPFSATGSNGSRRELPLSKFISVKPPLEFRFPEAAIRQCVQPTEAVWKRNRYEGKQARLG